MTAAALTLKRSGLRFIEIYHYSRVSIALAAGLMTVVSARVLLGSVREDAAVLTAFGVLGAYWLDDLLDLPRDEAREPRLRKTRRVRVTLMIAGLATIAVGGAPVLAREPIRLQLLFALLFLATAGFCLWRHLGRKRQHKSWRYGIESLAWSAACVLAPPLAAGAALSLQTWMAFAFFFLLMIPVIDLWQHSDRQSPRWAALLAGFCVISSAMALAGIALGWFSWLNFALLAAPAANLLMLAVRQATLVTNESLFKELSVGLNSLCGLFVAGAYASGMKMSDAGPRSATDYLQLALLACVATLIAANVVRRRAEGHAPVRRESGSLAIIVMGLAVFGFQVCLYSFHVQSWLMPDMHVVWIDSEMAHVTGSAIAAAGVALLAAGYGQMGSSWRIGIDHLRPGNLVTSGLFGRSRNPIYLAIDLYMAGMFLMNGTPVFLLFALLTPLFLHALVLGEERFLAREFGSDYSEYARRTPRYI